MSIFGTIMSKIFGHSAEASPTSQSEGAPATGGDGTPSPTIASSAPTPGAASSVDVSAVLTDLAAKAGQPSNWRTAIVDLMKLLNLDSSLENRKELAQELHYTGDTNDSATMNVWLHKQVMTKLAENGGNVPADLKG
ncbi:MAG: DUF3597 domain-containing protein [Janthinobacterium lividum]